MLDPAKVAQYFKVLEDENARLRFSLAAAHALLREASDEWVPHASVLSAAIVHALRDAPDAAAGGEHDVPGRA